MRRTGGSRPAACGLFVLALALVSTGFPETATAAPLVPAPGTGRGVLSGGAPPSEEGASLSYTPGIGGSCAGDQTGVFTAGGENVGLPARICIGRFPASAVNLSITAPSGQRIVIPTLEYDVPGFGFNIYLAFSVLPSPPRTRYRMERAVDHRQGVPDPDPFVAKGPISGDGVGTYTAHLTVGGTTKTASFTLGPPASPRIQSLSDSPIAPGARVQFGVLGKKPLSVFRVTVFGPGPPNDAAHVATPWPLRTTIAARANKQGEAIVTLDVAANSDVGTFEALLEPYTHSPRPGHVYPDIAIFTVGSPTTPPPVRQYTVTDDVNLRHDPTSTSASLSLIPSGSQITIDCVATGEQIDGPRGLTDKWDKTVWKGFGGYVTDQYVDTKNDVNDRSIIPAC